MTNKIFLRSKIFSQLLCLLLGSALLIFSTSRSNAVTVGYWRFESGAFLNDSGGHASGPFNLTNNGTNNGNDDVALPASGAGAFFPNYIPATGAANLRASLLTTAEGDSFLVPYDPAFFSGEFTIEALVHYEDNGAYQTIASNRNGIGGFDFFVKVGDPAGGNGLAVSVRGPRVESEMYSNILLTSGSDYYLAVTVSFLSGTRTFFVKDLTNGGAILTEQGSLSTDSQLANPNGSFFIGARAATQHWNGLIDEVRYSNRALSKAELLISGDKSSPKITITPSAGANGSISPNTPRTVNGPGPVYMDFTATPAINYTVDEWLVNNAAVQSGGINFRVNSVTANTRVQVTFKPVPPFADSDGDGMDDEWERQYFGDLDKAGPGTNHDFDGFTDLEEYVHGTHPEFVDPRAAYQPDGVIGDGVGSLLGYGIFDRNASGQEVLRRVSPGHSKTVLVDIQNAGYLRDTITVSGFGSSGNFRVSYTWVSPTGPVSITKKVVNGTKRFKSMRGGESGQPGNPGAKRRIKVRITALPNAQFGEMFGGIIRLTSSDGLSKDAVYFAVGVGVVPPSPTKN